MVTHVCSYEVGVRVYGKGYMRMCVCVCVRACVCVWYFALQYH